MAEESLTALTEEVKEEECLSEPWRSQREPVCPKTWAQSNGLYLLRHDGRRASRKQRGRKKATGGSRRIEQKTRGRDALVLSGAPSHLLPLTAALSPCLCSPSGSEENTYLLYVLFSFSLPSLFVIVLSVGVKTKRKINNAFSPSSPL